MAGRTDSLRRKACALLGAWSSQPPEQVAVGNQTAPTAVVASAAALEITVHGWDLAQAIGRAMPIPETLAASLLPVAGALVSVHDRGGLFAPVREVSDGRSPEANLLAFLGRDRSIPPASLQAKPGTGPRLAS